MPVPTAIVTIVTYNSAEDIGQCIRSLAGHFPMLAQGHAEVHVVDNDSRDGTPDLLRALAAEFDWLRLHFPKRNLGFGVGNNVVLRAVPARAHILLNADAWLVADSLTPALEHLFANPSIGIIGLPLIFPDGAPQTSSFMPSAWHRWLMLMLGLRTPARALLGFAPMRALMRLFPFSRNFAANHGRKPLDLDDLGAVAASASGETRRVAWVAGAAMVLSPDFIRASGGFDPALFLYGEDEDLCIQAHRLGFGVETLQTAPVVHKLGWGGGGGFRPHVARMKYDSLAYFITKNIDGTFDRMMMRLLLPVYVYGRHIVHFLRRDSK